MTATKIVAPRDVPTEMAERLALYTHRRDCVEGLADPPRFAGGHRAHDVVRAQRAIADVCNALGLTPDDLDAQ